MKNNRNQGGGEDSGEKTKEIHVLRLWTETIELWWRWWMENNRNLLIAMKCGGGGVGWKTVEMWYWRRKAIEMWKWW